MGFLLRLIFRSLNRRLEGAQAQSEATRRSLAALAEDQGFRAYLAQEDLRLLRAIGNGVPLDEYRTLVGRRLELGVILHEANSAREALAQLAKVGHN